jgi:hypothetical protein
MLLGRSFSTWMRIRSPVVQARLPRPVRAVALFAVLLLPPVRHALEASMTAQMLLQLPLLVGVGWLLPAALLPRWRAGLAAWNRQGVSA